MKKPSRSYQVNHLPSHEHRVMRDGCYFRLGSKAGGTEAASKDVEAAAAEGAGGNKETGGGGTAQTGGRDPQNPGPFQPG